MEDDQRILDLLHALDRLPGPDHNSHGDLADAVTDGALNEADRRIIESALSDLGYVQIPERLLRRPYDGVTGLGRGCPELDFDGSPNDPVTWDTRFFSYP